MLGAFLHCSPTCFWSQGLSRNLELTVFNRLVGQPARFQDLPVFMHPNTGVADVYQVQPSHRRWGSTLWQALY